MDSARRTLQEDRVHDETGTESGSAERHDDADAAGRAVRPAGAAAAHHAKDQLLASMGHELRNPLNAIATAVEVLNRAEPTAPESQSARRIIGRQTRRLAELIGELGEAGRTLADGIELARRPVDLGALLGRAIDRAGPAAAARVQRLERRLGSARIVVADAERLGDAFDRLLAEALRSAADGRVIGVRLDDNGSEALVEVGDGEALDRAEGVTVPAAAAIHPGSGLGIALTLVRYVVELHGGRIDALRAGGAAGGTVFRVRLPAGDAA